MVCRCECQKPMSPVRRTFCLLTLFDLLVSFLLWVLYTQVKGLSPTDAFVAEVVHYGIHSSLFDLVMLAAFRFLSLILAYGLFRLHNPWVVAVTCSVSSGFLIAKVFLFSFAAKDTSGQQAPLLDYLLLISSFVLSWAETWFLDFRVLPRELKERLEELKRAASEASPLLYGGYRQGYESSGNASRFYSPLGGSPPNEPVPPQVAPKAKPVVVEVAPSPLPADERSRLIQRAKGNLDIVKDLVQKTGWKLQESRNGSDVFVLKDRRFGKVFKVETILHVSTEVLFEDLFHKVKDLPSWNPSIAHSERVDVLDENTDVCYVCVKDQAGGMVSGRDFVDVRYYEATSTEHGNKYLLSSVFCEHPKKPMLGEFVRGENGPNAWILEPSPPSADGTQRTHFTSVLNTNLKGWLPQKVVDQALSQVLIDLVTSLHSKCSSTRVVA